jgi:xanthine dehydrogenase molybdopterin-binding subunit B
MEAANTTRVPNAFPTSASTGADLNGMATQYACRELVERLKAFAILRALRSVRKDKPFPSLPLTPEKVFMYLHG